MTKPWWDQEKSIAKDLGGKSNAGSGAFDRKGDVRTPEFLVEAKWTSKKSMTVQSSVLEKIWTEALAVGRTPVLQIELNDRRYALIEWDDFLAMSEVSDGA